MQHGTSGRLVFATLLLALGTTPPAAAIDLSGDYVGSVPVPVTATAVQAGTILRLIGHNVVNSATYVVNECRQDPDGLSDAGSDPGTLSSERQAVPPADQLRSSFHRRVPERRPSLLAGLLPGQRQSPRHQPP
jgi:hypothetical protein